MRKIIDIIPIVTVRPTDGAPLPAFTDAKRAGEGLEQRIREALGKNIEIEIRYETEAQCEHCRMPWTEDGEDHNGGCCDRDAANDPDRLKEMTKVADAISAETFYRYDEDGRRGRVAVNWPDQFGAAVSDWLEKGRPAAAVPPLLHMAAHVEASGWCTVWSDPGPSGCSLARLADQVIRDDRPEGLASDLRSLVDDMGLTPAKELA